MTMGGRLVGLLAVLLIAAVFLVGTLQNMGNSFVDAGAHAFALPSLAAVAVFSAFAAWLIHLRGRRWRRIAVDFVEPVANPATFWTEPAPESALPVATEAIVESALLPAQPEGADLAARARFVAMTFAFPEVRRESHDWPLHMTCRPTRFTLTLRHAALGYRLEFCNRGAEALGPLIIRADLVAAGRLMAQPRQAGTGADPLPLCHYLDNLRAGETIELTGELRLPLADITAMRLGTAELLVPLLRLCAESAGEFRPALSVSAFFAIGLPPLAAGGGIQPFRLDSGPGIWRKLAARRMIDAELS